MSVSIKYKGTEIASASTETTKTIKTAGKYCEADILVENTPDGGDAPVINPLTITENGTYTAPSGVDGYSPVTVNVPQGIIPTGNINITDTNPTDVTNYATATVVDADLVAENIKEGVNILGVLGTFAGGGSLPTSITKIDGGSFVLSANTTANAHSISHNLGVEPRAFAVWSELLYGTTEPTNMLVATAIFKQQISDANSGFYGYARKLSNGTIGTSAGPVDYANAATTTTITVYVNLTYKAGVEYKWIAWA